MLYLLPGLGANKHMYGYHWQNKSNIKLIDWPEYSGEKTLQEVALRIIIKNSLTSTDYIGGSSLGGMVALEIFKKLRNPKVVLLGSAFSPAEVSPLLLNLSPLTKSITPNFIQQLMGNIDNKLLEKFPKNNTNFIIAMCSAILNWEGYNGDITNILRIHGENDWVITCPTNCLIIRNAGHQIAISNGKECMDLISRIF